MFSRCSFIEIFKKPLELALRKYFDNPSADILSNTDTYTDINTHANSDTNTNSNTNTNFNANTNTNT